MSGHSKWSQIKRKKETNDKEKGKIFSQLSKLITTAAIEGEGVRLRLAIEKAKEANMPKDNIKRAIEKGRGSDKSVSKEVIYEAFTVGGIALYIIASTDNSNRTTAQIKNILEKYEGKLGAQGSTAYLFKDNTPLFPMHIGNEKEKTQVQRLIEALRGFEDIQDIFTTAIL